LIEYDLGITKNLNILTTHHKTISQCHSCQWTIIIII